MLDIHPKIANAHACHGAGLPDSRSPVHPAGLLPCPGVDMTVLTRIQLRPRLVAMTAERNKALACGDLETYDACCAELDTLLDQWIPQQRCEHGNVGFP